MTSGVAKSKTSFKGKNDKTPATINRQQIEYAQNGYTSSGVLTRETPIAATNKLETSSTSPIVSEPLPINRATASQLNFPPVTKGGFGDEISSVGIASAKNVQTQTSSEYSNNFFSANKADPFEAIQTSSASNSDASPNNHEFPATYVNTAKSVTHTITDTNNNNNNGGEKIKQALRSPMKPTTTSKQQQQQNTMKITLPTPKPFHRPPPSQIVSASSHQDIVSQQKSDTATSNEKGGSKRVYSLGDHGKCFFSLNYPCEGFSFHGCYLEIIIR